MDELFQFFGCTDFDAFCQKIGQTTATERYRYLAEFLQTRKPAEVSTGYRALAALCAQNYFDFVLTTNMDPLLDDALAAARLWRRDYLLIVNGVIRPDRLELLLRGQSPRVIVCNRGDVAALIESSQVRLIGPGNRRFKARVSGNQLKVAARQARMRHQTDHSDRHGRAAAAAVSVVEQASCRRVIDDPVAGVVRRANAAARPELVRGQVAGRHTQSPEHRQTQLNGIGSRYEIGQHVPVGGRTQCLSQHELVCAGAAGQRVVTRTAEQAVVAVATHQPVGTGTTVEPCRRRQYR
jgi:hypothetical protein